MVLGHTPSRFACKPSLGLALWAEMGVGSNIPTLKQNLSQKSAWEKCELPSIFVVKNPTEGQTLEPKVQTEYNNREKRPLSSKE